MRNGRFREIISEVSLCPPPSQVFFVLTSFVFLSCKLGLIMFCLWQDNVKNTGETGIEELILEGHLGITKELLAFQTSEKKYQIGCEKGGANLIKVSSKCRY